MKFNEEIMIEAKVFKKRCKLSQIHNMF